MDALAIIQRLGSGDLLDDLAKALQDTATEVVETGKPGTVTLKFKISNKKQGDCLVMIDETVSRVSPKEDPRGAFFYSVEGGLFREDPRQFPLEFREVVDKGTGEIRDVPVSAAQERTVR